MAVLKDQQNKRNFSRNEHNQNDKRLTNNHQKENRASAYRNTENARNYSQYEYYPVQGNESANNTLKQEEFILTGRNPIREALNRICARNCPKSKRTKDSDTGR